MPYSIGERDGRFCVLGPDGIPAPGGCHDSRRDALAHQRALIANVKDAVTAGAQTAAISDAFPVDPPAAWFEQVPPWFKPNMKISLVTEGPEAGRVAATVANRGTFILSGTGEKWQSPPSPSGYEEAMQGDTVTADGSIIKTANLAADVNHQNERANFHQARDAAANTAIALARVRYIDTPYGTVALGAAWPGLSDLQVRKMQASALSGDWRWREEFGGYDLAMAQFVNSPGLPLPNRPTFQPYAMAASLGIEHPPILGSWICDDSGVCTLMPDDPTVTLTLTPDETRRLHAFLTSPQTAAAACSCGGHTAATVMDGTPPPPNPVGPPASGGDLGQVTRAEFAALTARVEVLEADAMDRQLSELDGIMAALPEPQTAAPFGAPAQNPLATPEDIATAVLAVDKAADPAAEKARIIAAAKAIGATDQLPADWDGSTAKVPANA